MDPAATPTPPSCDGRNNQPDYGPLTEEEEAYMASEASCYKPSERECFQLLKMRSTANVKSVWKAEA